MKKSIFSRNIHDVSALTRIEESRIRFIESRFRSSFEAAGVDLESVYYDHRRVTMLQKIHEMLFVKRRSIEDIRSELLRDRPGHHRPVRVIAVTSGKGGVGKTTVAINLAVALSRHGMQTLLFDADLGLANVHVLAGLSPRWTLIDLIEGDVTIDEVLTDGPEDIKVVCGGSGVAKLADLDRRLTDYLSRELERLGAAFDTVVIDTGAGISSQVLQFLGLADDIVVIASPNIAATLDAYSLIKVVREARLSGQIRVLVNQVEDRQQSDAVFDKISLCAERFLRFRPGHLGYLLSDPRVERANQQRVPLVVADPGSANARLFLEIASLFCPRRMAGGETSEARARSLAALSSG